jgi:protoheme IX farnesyltransferase
MSTAISVKSIANRQAYSWKEWAILLFSLGKIRISLLVTLSTATGYLLAAEEITIQMLVPAAAVFLLACGSCALNQFQERKIDALMERTKNRPLPSGKLNPYSALLISLGLISIGSFTLFRGASLLAGILGLFAIFWYNGIYTYLKRKTAFAAIPGALIGAIPPALGWVSGGGSLLDPRIWAVVFFFFMWQVPHFWLLLLNFGKDYENGGFPSLTQVFTSAQLRRMTFVWIFATAVTCVIIPLFGVVESQAINGSLFAAGLWLVWKTSRILRANKREFPFRFNFKVINTYVLLVMFLFTLDKLFH